MKALNIIKYLFVLAGAVMLIVAAVLYTNTRSFLSSAVTAEGTVTALERHEGQRGESPTYSPVVSFQGPDGVITFRSSVSSNPPSYSVGETVGVLYAPSNPNDARIDATGALWLGPIISGGLGVVFFLIGVGMIVVPARRRHAKDNLLRQGTPVQTNFQRVELNEAVSMNGRSPFRVVTQWLDPTTSTVHVFYSDNLWFDPTEFIKQKHITVFIDRMNPKKYSMDLPFLPKHAD